MSLAALIAPALLLVEDLRGGVSDAPVIAASCALIVILVMARVSDLLATQNLAGARERALRQAGARLVAASSEGDAAEALRRAVADLMPEGVPYKLYLAGDEVSADALPAQAEIDYRATLVDVAALPGDVAAALAGFPTALFTAVGAVAPSPGGLRRRSAYLAAAPARLHELRPSFDALMAQAAMAIERITLSFEVNRRSSEDYFRTLIRSASDVILILDDNETIRYASPSATTVFGRPISSTRPCPP